VLNENHEVGISFNPASVHYISESIDTCKTG
jgi:hypothetical protein